MLRYTVDLHRARPLIGAVLIPALIALLVALLVRTITTSSGAYRWPQVRAQGETYAFRTAALLQSDTDQAIIWQPVSAESDAATPLIAQPIAQPGPTTGLLPYPDVMPERWQVAPASSESFHVVWLEHDERLRSALLAPYGETQRGPITLAFRAGRAFITAALPDHSLLVVWRSPDSGQVMAQIIDPAGRPDPSSTTALNQTEHIAVAVDHSGTLHFAWTEAGASGARTLYYQTATSDSLVLDAPSLIHTVELAPSESIAALLLGLDGTHAYLMWSITHADHPDIERVFVLAFPLGQPQHAPVSEIRIPQTPSPYQTFAADTGPIALDRVRPLAADTELAAGLRWPLVGSGQNVVLPLAITYRTPSGWRPGVVYFQDGTPLGYQQIADHPADAGPPAIAVDPAGQLFAAWSGLSGTTSILYSAALTNEGLIAPFSRKTGIALAAGLVAGAATWALWWWFRTDSSA